MNELGNQIRAALKARKMTQAALARAVGVTPVYISCIVLGTKSPSGDLTRKIAIQLGMSEEDGLRLIAAAARLRGF